MQQAAGGLDGGGTQSAYISPGFQGADNNELPWQMEGVEEGKAMALVGVTRLGGVVWLVPPGSTGFCQASAMSVSFRRA